MLPVARHGAIVEAVNSATTISTDQLVQLLGVSAETVRRDLALLEERGALRRVHGGAASIQNRTAEASFSERASAQHAAKIYMARIATDLLVNGQTVTIDIGTSAVEVARAIAPGWRGTVATPSLLVAAELAGRSGIDVLISGGRVRGGDLACANAHAKALFADLYADIAFVGSGALDAAAGLTDYHLDEVDIRRTIIANSARSYVLADSSKLGHIAPHRVCGLDAVSGLITDSPAPAITAAINDAGGEVLS